MRNRLYGFEIYLVNVKTIRTIVQIFVAFSEKLNFNMFEQNVSYIFWIVWSDVEKSMIPVNSHMNELKVPKSFPYPWLWVRFSKKGRLE